MLYSVLVLVYIRVRPVLKLIDRIVGHGFNRRYQASQRSEDTMASEAFKCKANLPEHALSAPEEGIVQFQLLLMKIPEPLNM